LQYILPYLVSFIKQEDKSLVKSKMVEVLIICLDQVKGEHLDPVDYRVFPDYVMAMLLDNYFGCNENFNEVEDEVIQLTILKNLGKLVMIAEQFKYMAQVSIAENIQNSESSGKA